VNELQASVRQLGLLTPLTCAYVGTQESEPVVLIDGRHRFDALKRMAAEETAWAKSGKVDLKVFYGLTRSELHVLATYLNRTRKALRKGEYFKAIVKIYEEKQREIEENTGKPVRETDLFDAIHARELTNRDFDLSIGRIVGLSAFDDEEDDSWYPLVGAFQNEKYSLDGQTLYCPLTAGNLAEFLSYLCRPHPYSDFGEKRSVELGNVLELGRLFRRTVLSEPVVNRGDVTHTTVGCKFWCMAALGSLMALFDPLPVPSASLSVLANEDIDWKSVRSLLASYVKVMKHQAKIVSDFKSTNEPGFLENAWSYQTQRDQVKFPLRKALQENGCRFRKEV
jgi:hypothetical protein